MIQLWLAAVGCSHGDASSAAFIGGEDEACDCVVPLITDRMWAATERTQMKFATHICSAALVNVSRFVTMRSETEGNYIFSSVPDDERRIQSTHTTCIPIIFFFLVEMPAVLHLWRILCLHFCSYWEKGTKQTRQHAVTVHWHGNMSSRHFEYTVLCRHQPQRCLSWNNESST